MSLIKSLMRSAAARRQPRHPEPDRPDAFGVLPGHITGDPRGPRIPGAPDAIDEFRALPVAEQYAKIEADLAGLTDDERKVVLDLLKGWLTRPWLPQPGPQTQVVNSTADVILVGGSGGGGKSDLLLGLAFTAHKRSRILRREFVDLAFLTERAIEINKGRDGYAQSPHPVLRTKDGRVIEFGACSRPGDEQSYQGRPVDLLAIDEAAQFLESQIRYLMGWVRSTDPSQRCRVILASNPPLSDDGQWLVKMFRPWLDPHYPNRAKPCELRWFITDAIGDDVEVDGPGPHPVGERMVMALSRTFIPAKLKDNAYLARTDYVDKLDALPEPLRSAIRDGNFMAVREDNAWQVIPSSWIRAAQARWTPERPPDQGMTCIAADIAQGGSARTVIAKRYGNWFAPLTVRKGSETPDGKSVSILILLERESGCLVVVDMGGGYGGDTKTRLVDNDIPVFGYRGADPATAKARTGQDFYNKRAQDWWQLREALDPAGTERIALPPDEDLAVELASVRIDANMMQQRGVIKVESKEDIVSRLGQSPDKADAVVMCRAHGGLLEYQKKLQGRLQGQRPRVVVGHSQAKRYG